MYKNPKPIYLIYYFLQVLKGILKYKSIKNDSLKRPVFSYISP